MQLNEVIEFYPEQSNSKVEKGVKRHITDTDLNAIPPKRGKQPTKETTKFSASSNVGNINLLYENVSMIVWS